MIVLALFAAATLSGPDLGALVDKLDACMIARTDEFAPANEAADVTVDAAFEACLTEEANLRVALQDRAKADPTLTKGGAKRVEQFSYDLAVSSARGRALVRLVRMRAANARN